MSGRISESKLQEVVHKWLQEALSDEYLMRVDRKTPWNKDALKEHLAQHDAFFHEALADIETSNYRSVKVIAEGLIKEHGLPVDAGSTDYNRLCASLLHAVASFHRKASSPHFNPLKSQQAPVLNSTASVPEQLAAAVCPSVAEAVEKYIAIKMDNDEWKATSARDMAPQLRRFAELVGGELRMDALTNDHMRQYYALLNKLPSGRFKSYYEGKTTKELLEMQIDPRHLLKTKSLKSRVDNVRSFINWAELEGYVASAKKLNAALSLKKLNMKAKAAVRRGFTDEELKALFHTPQFYGTAKGRKGLTTAWQFWAPILGLFTGARLEEICQLHLDDIREEDGVPYIDINAEGDKDVKTEAGKRRVPIHPFLVELGFLDRVKVRREMGEEHLFSRATLSQRHVNVSANVTQWFTRYRRGCGVGAGSADVSDVTFHSFRHTFITWAKLHDIDRMKLKEVVGHEADLSDVTSIYEGRYPVSMLMKDVIEPVDFHTKLGLDFLKSHEWVKRFE